MDLTQRLESIHSWLPTTLYVIAILWLLPRVCHIFRTLINSVFTTIKSLYSKPSLRQKYGNWVLITGATDGIGEALAKNFARRGHSLVIFGRNTSKLEKTKHELNKLCVSPEQKIICIKADFSQSCPQLYEAIKEKLEPIKSELGILINNVGVHIDKPKPYLNMEDSLVWNMMKVNVIATAMMTRVVLSFMVENRRGLIVNVSSTAAVRPVALDALYCSTKKFVDYFGESLDMEYSHMGIKVQTLAPFFVTTKMVATGKYLQKPNLCFPSAETYANSVMSSIGKSGHITGYWVHTFVVFWMKRLPKCIFSPLSKLVLRSLYGKDEAPQTEKV